MTGTSRAASAPTSQASSSPPAEASAATAPPAASTVTTSASQPGEEPVQARRRRPRSEPQNTGSGLAPAASTASHERVDEGGVAGQLVRPVEDDADGRAGPASAQRSPCTPYAGMRRGGVEPLAGQQHGVGQEPGQLAPGCPGRPRPGTPAPRRRRRPARWTSAISSASGSGLAAEHDRRHAGGEQRGEPVRPGPPAAEQPYDDEVGAVEQGGHLVGGDPGGVGQPVVGAAGAGGQQVGVGGGEQQDAHGRLRKVTPWALTGATGRCGWVRRQPVRRPERTAHRRMGRGRSAPGDQLSGAGGRCPWNALPGARYDDNRR